MIRAFLITIIIWLIPMFAHADFSPVSTRIIDSDLTGASPNGTLNYVPLDLRPDSIATIEVDAGIVVRVVREFHGVDVPVAGLELTARPGVSAVTDDSGVARFNVCSPGERNPRIVAPLRNTHFIITNGSEPYRVVIDAPCSGGVLARFTSSSDGGQALGIWQIAQTGKRKLEASVGLDFWDSRMTFVWPSSSDYYSWGQVNISRGDHWDVVGHEMGHAIYDLGKLGAFGGGSHKIDECYGEALALSEGWASFFSAWVSVDIADPDAKFEYMVPRRAPLRFESIPADVCKSEKNEWRVTGFFWDIIDTNDDGEIMQEPFARTWKALTGSRVRSTSEAMKRLLATGLDRRQLEEIWELNFLTRAP